MTNNFSFSHSVFKRLVSQGRQKVSLCGFSTLLENFFINFRIVVCNFFEFGRSKICRFGRGILEFRKSWFDIAGMHNIVSIDMLQSDLIFALTKLKAFADDIEKFNMSF